MKPRDAGYIHDIVEAAEAIRSFIGGVEEAEFHAIRLLQSAVIRELLIIGEATKRLSVEFRDRHPDIPWKRMAGMRDVLVHEYRETSLYHVWTTVTRSVPELLWALKPLLPSRDDSGTRRGYPST